MRYATWKVVVYAAILAFAIWSIYLFFFNVPLLTEITREDSVAETLSALAYLAAAGLFTVAWIRGQFRNIFVLGYALLFLFVGGEEISWGQRIIGIQTPESLAQINVQRETNLHNIDGINQHIRLVGLAVVLTIAILMPLARQWFDVFRRLFDRLSIPIIATWTIPITVISVSFMAVPRLLLDGSVFSLDEVGELMLSVVFLLFAIEHLAQGRAARPSVAANTPP